MKKSATNQFGDGLVTDFHPLTTKNTTLIDALNATLVTTKGNEMILQNDTGNIKINEEVKLPDGFIPVGIKEYNGIIYIASWNLTNSLGQIGTYPSPDYSNMSNESRVPLLQKYLALKVFREYRLGANPLYELIDSLSNFNFDLLHPVSIEILPSYDGSVNLILTDDKNPPRLINSGFAITEDGLCFAPGRHNNEDNLYDSDKFDLLTSLIKRTSSFPGVTYDGVLNTGNLKVGNYTLYFKYLDYDGNETDFIAWSGLISIFKGMDGDPFSIDGGVEDMNANKSIQISLSNLDKAYNFIKVYYTRTSSAIDSNRIPQAYCIDKKFPYTGEDTCKIIITGDENIEQIPLSEINTLYFVSDTAKTLALCLNILFLGNTTTSEINYDLLTRISLCFYPTVTKTLSKNKIGHISPKNYIDDSNLSESESTHTYLNEYYNTKNIYYNVGYWNEEYYRFGIVYILEDNTKTLVFNICGGELTFLNSTANEGYIQVDDRNYIPYVDIDPNGCSITTSDVTSNLDYIIIDSRGEDLDNLPINNTVNTRGVIRINDLYENDSYIYGIKIQVDLNVLSFLRDKLHIKGYFIVRQKRIPTIACLGFTLPWDKEAKVPIVTYKATKRIGTLEDTRLGNCLGGEVEEGVTPAKSKYFFVESFINQIGNECRDSAKSTDLDNDNSDYSKLIRGVTNTYYTRLHYIDPKAIDRKIIDIELTNSSVILTASYSPINNNKIYYFITATNVEEAKNYLTVVDSLGNINIDSYLSYELLYNKYQNPPTGSTYKLYWISFDRGNIEIPNSGFESLFEEIPTASVLLYLDLLKYQISIDPTNSYKTLEECELFLKEYLNNNSEANYNITTYLYQDDSTVYLLGSAESVTITSSIVHYTDSTVNNSKLTGGYLEELIKEYNNKRYTFISGIDLYSFTTNGNKYNRSVERYFINRSFYLWRKDKASNKFDINVPASVVKHYIDLYKDCDGQQLTAICPEFEVRLTYYNSIFTGAKYRVKYTPYLVGYLVPNASNHRIFYLDDKTDISVPVSNPLNPRIFNIIAVTDTVPIVAVNNTIFKSVIGSEAEAYRFAYINEEHSPNRQKASGDSELNDGNNLDSDDFNLVRGIYSPYLGIDSNLLEIQYSNNPNIETAENQCLTFNIYYPENSNEFLVRFNNDSAYYPISNIIPINISLPTLLYNGDCFLCTFTHRVNRNFNDPVAPTNDHILDSETWKKNYYPDTLSNDDKGELKKGIERLNLINRGDVNAVKLGSWITIKVKASYNLSIRSLDESHLLEKGVMGRARGFYPLLQASADGGFKIPNSYVINDAFGATTGELYYLTIIDAPYINNDYSNRIAYSDIDVTGAFKNGYRIFRGLHYRDYTKQYGAITKLVELLSNLLCIFEHGTALIPINERALAAEGSGGEVYINNSNVLPETPRILNDMYGSLWADSIVKTPYYVYGIDGARKKIWRTNGSLFEIISDFRVEKFLLDNLTIDENDTLPYLGIKNIVTHYNANKSDVMFTFYYKPFTWDITYDDCDKEIDRTIDTDDSFNDELAWNLCYNEILLKFETFYSWVPLVSANVDNQFYSFDRECAREIITKSQESSQTPRLSTNRTEIQRHIPESTPYLWKHGPVGNNKPQPTYWYGEQHPFEFEFVVNDLPSLLKIYDNLVIISNNAEPESFHFTIEGDNYEFSEDKPNMYVRLEATKELFLKQLGSFISFNSNYEKLVGTLSKLVKSTIFPLYYNKINTFNNIYNVYTLMLDNSLSRDYSELSGSEINWDEDLGQFLITTHIKNQPIDKHGRLRGNSRYLEGKWEVLIPSITLMQKNETWVNNLPPLVVNPTISASDFSNFTIENTGLPNTYSLGDIDTTNWTFRKETKIRDKYCKIKIRYSGTKLAVISAVITTFTISYA